VFHIAKSLKILIKLYIALMKNDLSQKMLPVAFWSDGGRIWVEFSDVLSQGFPVFPKKITTTDRGVDMRLTPTPRTLQGGSQAYSSIVLGSLSAAEVQQPGSQKAFNSPINPHFKAVS
jgi:hypothetical protein